MEIDATVKSRRSGQIDYLEEKCASVKGLIHTMVRLLLRGDFVQVQASSYTTIWPPLLSHEPKLIIDWLHDHYPVSTEGAISFLRDEVVENLRSDRFLLVQADDSAMEYVATTRDNFNDVLLQYSRHGGFHAAKIVNHKLQATTTLFYAGQALDYVEQQTSEDYPKEDTKVNKTEVHTITDSQSAIGIPQKPPEENVRAMAVGLLATLLQEHDWKSVASISRMMAARERKQHGYGCVEKAY
jgi:hypothetical protein